MGHLDGHITAPSTTNPGYDKWEIENSVIMSQLINSMVPEISESFYRMKTAKAIWDTVASTFSRRGNYAQEFELIRSIDHSEHIQMLPEEEEGYPSQGPGYEQHHNRN